MRVREFCTLTSYQINLTSWKHKNEFRLSKIARNYTTGPIFKSYLHNTPFFLSQKLNPEKKTALTEIVCIIPWLPGIRSILAIPGFNTPCRTPTKPFLTLTFHFFLYSSDLIMSSKNCWSLDEMKSILFHLSLYFHIFNLLLSISCIIIMIIQKTICYKIVMSRS